MQAATKSVVRSGVVPQFSFSNQISIRTLQQIKNSIPLLETKGDDIAKDFYEKEIFPKNISFFSKNPDTQARQAKTLSHFLLTLAQRAENLEKMNTHFERVSAKHSGFGIQAEHYPIFKSGILSAFKNNGAKPEAIAAWDELVTIVSKTLIAIEAKKYQNNVETIGGWTGTRKFTIKEKQDLGNGYNSYYAYPSDGKEIAFFNGGQYVTIKADLPGHGEQYRHIPICNTPCKHPYYRLTTTQTSEIGTFLAAKNVGDEIDLLHPAGKFVKKGHFNDMVLIGTGHSNMQLIQIANSAQNRNIYYFEIVNNSNKDTLKFIFEKYMEMNPNWKTIQINTDAGESFDYEAVTNFAPTKNADFYFCSPDPEFARSVDSVLTTCGVDKYNKFYEFEGPYEFLH